MIEGGEKFRDKEREERAREKRWMREKKRKRERKICR